MTRKKKSLRQHLEENPGATLVLDNDCWHMMKREYFELSEDAQYDDDYIEKYMLDSDSIPECDEAPERTLLRVLAEMAGFNVDYV